MNREGLSSKIGLAVVVICFVVSCVVVATRSSLTDDPSVVTIRFAHWQLEGGVRSALDAVAREYEKKCAAQGKKIRVEQLAVPEAVYSNWFITQLVGGTAPDLLEIGKGDSDDRRARYFRPLTSYVEETNPYDKGTELENLPWRDTFVGGLANVYSPTLLDYYQIPATVVTVRIFYNIDLYKKIVGDAPLPKNYAEFRELCLKVQAYSEKASDNILPIAGSRYNSPMMTDALMASQTQKLAPRISLQGDLFCDREQVGLAYLRGDWSLDTPEVKSGLKIVQDISRFMQPGYLQLERDDATFYFVQGEALMMCTGSWDVTSILQQVPFAVGAFQIPLPDPDDPEYGKYVRGQLSESGSGVTFAFGITRDSPHNDVALDFLRFLTSKEGAKIFTETSGWLPVTRNVEPDKRVAEFQPILDGYIDGFTIRIDGGNTQRVYDNNFYRLLDQKDGLSDFIESARPGYREALLEDLQLVDKGRVTNINRSDTTLASFWHQTVTAPEDDNVKRKLRELTELQNDEELSSALSRRTLAGATAH